MRKYAQKLNGSYTIEAALLIPIILFILLLVMYISFFLYNRQAATVIASQAVLKGVQMEQAGGAAIEQELDSFLKYETEERLIFVKEVTWDVAVTLTYVKVELSVLQQSPYKNLSCRISEKMKRIHPVSILWEAERIMK